MAWWNRKKTEKRDTSGTGLTLEQILFGSQTDDSTISKEQAMTIPALNAGVNLISNTVASLPIKLYQKDGQKIKCLDDDPRVELLNITTGDLLDGYQMKKALVDDYLIYGAGYMYKNMQRNTYKSLHYVHNPSVGVMLVNPDPIFKQMDFVIYGAVYKDYQLVKLTRKTQNGVTGTGILDEANKILSVAYNSLIFEDTMVRTGGNKKGFLKSVGKLSTDAITALKAAFKSFYSNNTENVVVLNSGLDFQEANNSSVEMQVNQNKITNNDDIAKMLNIPVELLQGKATGGNEMMYDSFIKLAILPILKAFETALNKDLLLEKEKGSFYFAFDTTDLVKADIVKRFTAYDFAVRNGILQIDEIRAKENYEPLGLDFIKLGLQDVLYNPQTKQIYTPNTNQSVDMNNPDSKGGDNNANRDPGEPGTA